MIKRTFVLFFCLFQTLAFSLLSQQSVASYKSDFDADGFTPYITSTSLLPEAFDVCADPCYENGPIIREDKAEWKENLSDLLRHRHSSYRFTTFESVPTTSFHFAVGFRALFKLLQPVALFKGVVILPDYYSFLHRLCPF